jgi:hypothetical protein
MRGESANKINKLRECKREGGGLWKRKMENEKFGLFFCMYSTSQIQRSHLLKKKKIQTVAHVSNIFIFPFN